MEFYTHYNRPKLNRENTGSESLVPNVRVIGNSERIAQMILAGQHLEANRIGYEYGPEDVIPEDAFVRPGRSADVTKVLDYIEDFGDRLRAHVASLAQKQPAIEPKEDKPANMPAEEKKATV